MVIGCLVGLILLPASLGAQDEGVQYFEKHPAEAERIIAAAKAYCRRFSKECAEQAISLLVLYKYFVLSGQVEPHAEVWRYISG